MTSKSIPKTVTKDMLSAFWLAFVTLTCFPLVLGIFICAELYWPSPKKMGPMNPHLPAILVLLSGAALLFATFMLFVRTPLRPDTELPNFSDFNGNVVSALALSLSTSIWGLLLFFMTRKWQIFVPFGAVTMSYNLLVIAPRSIGYWRENARREKASKQGNPLSSS